MHPASRPLFFSASCCLGLTLAAQKVPLALEAAVVPGSTEARITAAAPRALAALVFGVETGVFALPGGARLDLVPAVVAPIAVADDDGRSNFVVRFPPGAGAGLTFLAQAVAFDPRLSLGAVDALRVSVLRTLAVPARDEPIDVLVLFGQSNAEGFAPLASLPASLRGPFPTVRIWNELAGSWQAIEAGANNATLADTGRFGPELGLVDALADAGRTTWIVKFAAGATSLGPTPGPFNEWGVGAGELYPELVRRLGNACAAARQLGLQPRVRGICMMQGESDALDPALAARYHDLLFELVVQLRHDIKLAGADGGRLPPFVLGLVDPALTATGFPAVQAVRTAQQAVVGELPGCAAVETGAFEVQPDGVHFSANGVLALGRGFASALAEIAARR
jgi:hypothetical protein